MVRYSYSRVDLYSRCPYHYHLKYNLGLKEEIDLGQANHPLIIGSAMHHGLETKSVSEALKYYKDSFYDWSNLHEEEEMKLMYWLPKAFEVIERKFSGNVINEYKLLTDDFIGFVDLIITNEDGTHTIVDYKYSNAIEQYKESPQLSIYKYYLDKLGFNVKDMYYMFIPKTNIRRKKSTNETTFEFRNRMYEDMESKNIEVVKVEYHDSHIKEFFKKIDKIRNHSGPWEKNEDEYCFMCNNLKLKYSNAIMNWEGKINMVLPKNERKEKVIDNKPNFWVYGDSYVGKSTFVNDIDNVLFINTDGNVDNLTAPYVKLADTPKKVGRRTTIEFGWEKFADIITELANEDTGYEAIAIDLVENLYELARTYVFDKNGWNHESDGEWGKGWAMVQTEFENAIKRLKMLGFQIIYVSKEQVKTIRPRNGQEVDHFGPNIGSKQANFLSGTVDMTIRAYIDDHDNRKLQLVADKDSFGGSRIAFKNKETNLKYEDFIKEVVESQK